MRRCGVATTAHGALRGGARWRVLDLGLVARAWRMSSQGGPRGQLKEARASWAGVPRKEGRREIRLDSVAQAGKTGGR